MTALLALGARVEATGVDSGALGGGGTRGGDRLDELARWVAATQRSPLPRLPQRIRCIVLGPVRQRVRDLGDAVHVEPEQLTVPGESADAFEHGTRAADRYIDDGADLLIIASQVRDEDAAATTALVSTITGTEPVGLLPRGADAVDTKAWIERAVDLRDRRRSVASLRTRPDELLSALADPQLSTATGLLLQGTARRTPMILDGVGALAAALLCMDVQALAVQWWQVAASARDRAHRAAVQALALQPLLDLNTDVGDGTAGLLAVTLLRGAVISAREPDHG